MKQYACQVLQQEQINHDIFRLTFLCPEIAETARPGQFVHLRVSSGVDPLLRRPFSIHQVHDDGSIRLLYRVVGRGTTIIKDWQPGRTLDALGPLGNQFSIDPSVEHAIIIAGGMGSAPVFFLIDQLKKHCSSITLLWGTRTASEIFDISWLEERGVDVRIATEDGSLGERGYVTGLLEKMISQSVTGKMRGYICGPERMIAAVQRLTSSCSFPWQASLEGRMACGVGVCQGCPIQMTSGVVKMVCSDGPVFPLQEIVFED